MYDWFRSIAKVARKTSVHWTILFGNPLGSVSGHRTYIITNSVIVRKRKLDRVTVDAPTLPRYMGILAQADTTLECE